MKHLLFVCIESSNRSQMAQAFARLLGGDKMAATALAPTSPGA